MKEPGSDFEKTPLANRKNIVIFGQVNAGKSTLFNAILGQEAAIISPVKGTTTDPVTKAMELIGYGPVSLTDTAGLGDETQTGGLRIKRSLKMLSKADMVLYVADATDPSALTRYELDREHFTKISLPHLLVITKTDSIAQGQLEPFKAYLGAVFVDAANQLSIDALKDTLIQKLRTLTKEEPSLLGSILRENAQVVLVCPVDSEAPKGRLILPQVQLIRDCLDHNYRCVVTRVATLNQAICECGAVDLVVTDSQVFHQVAQIVPEEMPLTSFSILFANQKGELSEFIAGAKALETIVDGSKILIAEACTHNHTHEDIGRVKIPRLLDKMTGGAQYQLEYYAGHDFPDTLSTYDLIIHCGGCMLTPRAMKSRIAVAKEDGVPIVNYGLLFAFADGILSRSIALFT